MKIANIASMLLTILFAASALQALARPVSAVQEADAPDSFDGPQQAEVPVSSNKPEQPIDVVYHNQPCDEIIPNAKDTISVGPTGACEEVVHQDFGLKLCFRLEREDIIQVDLFSLQSGKEMSLASIDLSSATPSAQFKTSLVRLYFLSADFCADVKAKCLTLAAESCVGAGPPGHTCSSIREKVCFNA
eukprot:TRINITY_DN20197_c0_g1_i1.p1 TRINITY_DN20197_c0_g1~~TRINITY_DN20197_c0_g1_i1.p1  ORF type:complete len:189 (-),score=22.55 TRINITY_DN20197_c0_g1_i1:314-880(-)